MGLQTMSSLGGGGGGGGGGALLRQGSVYGLTLTEVEGHLGETLRSMNLGDLLRTVLPAAELRASAGASKKTVDEVWRDIEKDSSPCGQHSTMGEMTLEDFLSRAGVPVEGGGTGGCAGAHWLHRQYQPPEQYVARPVLYQDGGFLSQVGERKRGAEDGVVVEQRQKRGAEDGVVVERRQKRMIKNRESAARSRARKQAYTYELEIKVKELEAQIQRLKDEKKLNENPEVVYVPYMPGPKDLRRVSSAFF